MNLSQGEIEKVLAVNGDRIDKLTAQLATAELRALVAETMLRSIHQLLETNND